jgi:hypothetical protein
MDLHARVRGTPPSRHHHPNAAVAVAAAVAAAASANASPSLGNNCPKNEHEAAMWLAISSALQVADTQQRRWGGWKTSAARSGDDNGNNDDHSIAVVALAEYPNLWHPNPYGGRGADQGSASSLGLSPGQYASLFRDLLEAGDRLYQGGGGSCNRRQDGHQAFAAAMNATLRGLLCYETINIKERE